MNLLSITVMFVIASACGSAENGSTAVLVNLEKATITQGEPALLVLHIENHDWPTLDLDLGGDGRGNLDISVKTPDGREIVKPEPPLRREGVVFSGRVHLRLNESYSETLVLNKWFRFDEIGAYDVHVGLKTLANVGGTFLPIAASTVRLQVVNKDTEQLREACDVLAARVQDRRTAQDALAAALALSYVDDPVAAPSLERVLRNSSGFEQFAAGALARIADTEAVMALTRALHSPNEAQRSSARGALWSIANTTRDQAMRSQIEQALAGSPTK